MHFILVSMQMTMKICISNLCIVFREQWFQHENLHIKFVVKCDDDTRRQYHRLVSVNILYTCICKQATYMYININNIIFNSDINLTFLSQYTLEVRHHPQLFEGGQYLVEVGRNKCLTWQEVKQSQCQIFHLIKQDFCYAQTCSGRPTLWHVSIDRLGL
jgi:hypothetical protein